MIDYLQQNKDYVHNYALDNKDCHYAIKFLRKKRRKLYEVRDKWKTVLTFV